MLLGNYQFSDLFALSLKYSHESADNLIPSIDYTSDRFTLAFLFTITQNFGINLEYSHTEIEIGNLDTDTDEIYVEGLYSF